MSVVVPCFNCTNTIERAVDSIFRQTVQPKEVILVDDCSEDATWQLLQNLRTKYPQNWIKLDKLNENAGPAAARNAGWDMATSKYVAFLDADDAWHREKIRIQYQLMMQDDQIALSGHSSRVILQDGMLDCVALPQFEEIAHWDVSSISLLLSNRFSTPTVMLLRQLNFRFPLGKRYAEDYHLWCDISLSNRRCVFINCDLAYLFKSRYGDSGLSSNMLAMEHGVLDMYASMMRQKKIGLVSGIALIIFSMLKFVRRIFYMYCVRLKAIKNHVR